MSRITTQNLPTLMEQINRRLIGGEDFFTTFVNNEITGYPPHNIIKDGENRFELVLAVAGFSTDEIKITVENNKLAVDGIKNEEVFTNEREYLYRGLAFRNFRREFQLTDYIEVENAEFKDGLLTIRLIRNVPEKLKPKVIEITSK